MPLVINYAPGVTLHFVASLEIIISDCIMFMVQASGVNIIQHGTTLKVHIH
jgi:hypothetical protein